MLTITYYVIIASLTMLIVSLAGVFLAWRGLRHFFERNLPYLVSFSAGIFIVVVWTLTEEMRDIFANKFLVLGIILLGAGIIHTITKVFPGSHHHEDPDCKHEHSRINVRNMFIGDTLHSFVDGILLAPTFLISPIVGLSASVGIAFHEIVQELSEFFVYKKSGFSTKKALLWCLGSSVSILPGALIGLYLTETKWLTTPLLGLATGSFLYIVITDLIPDSYHQAKTASKFFMHTLSAFMGMLIMWMLH